jgi:hypothetical protein
MAVFRVLIAHATRQGSGFSTREYRINADSKSSAKDEALSRCRKENQNNTVFEVRSVEETK